MFNSTEGSTARLIQLCIGYFVFYVITGIAVKYFLGNPLAGFPGMNGIEYLVYSTIGGNLICLVVVFALGWHRFKSQNRVQVGPFQMPREFLYIIPSGICTAVVIPTTTLMYTLPISVMVAMVIMRGSVIVISRLVDAIQIRKGILTKKIYSEENWAVVFAVLAVGVHLFLTTGSGRFDFIHSPAAMGILGSYILAYAIRIYIMNHFKNTRKKGDTADNRGFFAIEQIAASGAILLGTVVCLFLPDVLGLQLTQLDLLQKSLSDPHPEFSQAILSGLAYGAVAFFSVFIFMFKGRTATFAGLVNRLTSLVAGTTATLVFFFAFGGKFPKLEDWISLGFILVSVAFLTRAERKRVEELTKNKEVQVEIKPPLATSIARPV